MDLVKINNLYKKFDINKHIYINEMKVNKKEIVGLVGNNGSGKTTILKMILGIIPYEKGDILYSNHINMSPVLSKKQLRTYLTGYQNLKIITIMYNISPVYLEEIINEFKLGGYIHKKVSSYSLGMKMKLIIAMSLIQKPNFLLLDEPLNGIDAISSKQIINFFNTNKNSMGIIITSHDEKLINKICDRVYIIKNNKVEEIPIDNNNSKIIITVKDPNRTIDKIKQSDFFKKKHTVLNKNKNIEIFTTRKEIPKIIRKLIQYNIDIYTVSYQRYEIE